MLHRPNSERWRWPARHDGWTVSVRDRDPNVGYPAYSILYVKYICGYIWYRNIARAHHQVDKRVSVMQ